MVQILLIISLATICVFEAVAICFILKSTREKSEQNFYLPIYDKNFKPLQPSESFQKFDKELSELLKNIKIKPEDNFTRFFVNFITEARQMITNAYVVASERIIEQKEKD